MQSETLGFALICPACCATLRVAAAVATCTSCSVRYQQQAGVWHLLAPERVGYFAQFIREYEAVRHAEGRGSQGPDYYRALPFADLSGHFRADWQIRARSYEALLRYVVTPRKGQGVLRVLDIGAGCGWLAHRLSEQGHLAAATDLLADPLDGLGAHIHYPTRFLPIQAEFERIPLADAQCDLVIINAALHYATDYVAALTEAVRLLKPGGALAIVDSPVYHDATSGAQMMRERGDAFQQKYGFRGDSLPYEGYLSYQRLATLAKQLGLHWQFYKPNHGLAWALRPWRARLRGRREPADFPLIVATKP
jgi:SAM-dependent methyltransferase